MFVTTIPAEKGSMIFGKRPQKSKRFALIDLGTNSVRIDIYDKRGKTLKRLYRGKVMIRLGDGVYKTGKLSRAGQARALKAFMDMAALLSDLDVKNVTAIGTSALRSAANADELLRVIRARTGIQVKVISGDEEARLIARGIMGNIDVPKQSFLLVDIGGGSTEVSLCVGKKIIYSRSLKLGANRLGQLYFKTMPPQFKKGELHPVLSLRQFLKTELAPLASVCARHQPKQVIGSSGTIRAVGKILKKLGRGAAVVRGDLSAFVAEISVMKREELLRIPGLEAKRVDLILPGSILLEEILYAVGVRSLKITEYSLRDGLLQKILGSGR